MTDRFLKDTGIKVLKISHLGFRHITNSKRPITSPADLKGLKIRTQPNPLHLQGFKAFGASPTPMAFAELFTALQQGVVDGQENPIYNILVMRIHEVQKYMTLTYHLWNAGGFIMSDKYYKGLPEDIRTAIDKAAVAAREAVIEDIAKSEPGWLAEIKKKTQVNELTNDQIAGLPEDRKGRVAQDGFDHRKGLFQQRSGPRSRRFRARQNHSRTSEISPTPRSTSIRFFRGNG